MYSIKLNRKKFILYASLVTFLLIFLMFFYLLLQLQSNIMLRDAVGQREKIIEIKNNVLLLGSKNFQETVNLPAKLDSTQEYYYYFTPRKLNAKDKLYLYIKGENLSFTISYNQNLIYNYRATNNQLIQSGGNFIKFIQIPDQFLGKKLKINFVPKLDSSYGIIIPDIKLGSHSDLKMKTIDENLVSLIFATVFIVFSIEIFILGMTLSIHHHPYRQSLLISLFAFSAAGYIFMRTPSAHNLFHRSLFLYFMEHVFFMLMPIALMLSLIEIFQKTKENYLSFLLLKLCTHALMINLIVQIVLTLNGQKEFVGMLRNSNIIYFVIFIIGFFVYLAIKYKQDESNIFKTIFLYITNLFFFILLIILYKLNSKHYINLLGLGILMFISRQVFVAMRFYYNSHRKLYLDKLYKSLALKDGLTKLNNRNAFENDIKNINKKNWDSLLLIIADINNLKRINDNFGHSYGDQILQNFSNVLQKCVDEFSNAVVYRFGGDEFILTIKNIDENKVKEVILFLQSTVKEKLAESEEHYFNFALGYQWVSIDDDFDYTKLLDKVDQNMYENKRYKKQQFSTFH